MVSPRIIRDAESLLIIICRFPLRCLLLILLEVPFRVWLQGFLHRNVFLREFLATKGEVLPIFQKLRGILPLNFLNLLSGVKNMVGQLASARVVNMIL